MTIYAYVLSLCKDWKISHFSHFKTVLLMLNLRTLYFTPSYINEKNSTGETPHPSTSVLDVSAISQ